MYTQFFYLSCEKVNCLAKLFSMRVTSEDTYLPTKLSFLLTKGHPVPSQGSHTCRLQTGRSSSRKILREVDLPGNDEGDSTIGGSPDLGVNCQISINENEFAQLKLLCDDIFDESNYLTTFTIKVRHEDRILKGDKDFHEVVEYLLLYRKSATFKPLKRKRENTSGDEYIYEVKELIKSPKKILMGSKIVEIFKPGQYEIAKIKPTEKGLKKINIF